MSPEIYLDAQQAYRLVNALPCSKRECKGQIQIMDTPADPEPLRAVCLECGQEIDLKTVKIVYEAKEKV